MRYAGFFWVILALGLTCLAVGCATTHYVYRAQFADNKEGVYYALPRTVIEVNLNLKCTTETKGQYYAGTPKGWSEGQDTKVTYSLDSPTFTVRSEPDPEQVFLVKVAGGILEKRSLMVALTEAGLITNASSEVENKTVELGVKTLETVATVAGKLVGVAAKDLEDVQKARLQLDSLRERRLELVTGMKGLADVNADTLNLMLKELDAQITTLEGEFNVTPQAKGCVIRYEIRPEAGASLKGIPLFAFDAAKGFKDLACCGVARLVETPPDWVILKEGGPEASDSNKVQIDVEPCCCTQAKHIKPAPVDGHPRGFYYRIPGAGTVTLALGGKEVGHALLGINQYGPIAALPICTGTVIKSTYAVDFHPSTGGIQKVTVGSDPIAPEQVGRVIEAAGNLAQAEQQRKANEAAAAEAKRKALLDSLNAFVGVVTGAATGTASK